MKTPSRFGGSVLDDIKFVDFGECGNNERNHAIVNAANNARFKWVFEDVANPTKILGLTFEDTCNGCRVKMFPPS